MKLDPKETQQIEKIIRRLEKDKRQWPWLRWVILFGSILIIVSAIYIYIKLNKLMEVTESFFDLYGYGNEFNLKMVELLVEGKLMNLRLEFFVLFEIFLYEILGCGILVYCLKNWNRHIKSGVMAKVIQQVISKD